MGEIADMMLDGTLCEGCGEFLDGDGEGFPRRCPSCSEYNRIADIDRGVRQLGASMKVSCPVCKKRVKATGLEQHQRDVHGKRLGLGKDAAR